MIRTSSSLMRAAAGAGSLPGQTPDEVAEALPAASRPVLHQVERMNVLVVDDAPGKLLAHESVLVDLGENIVTASSGREALELLLKRDFAVILLDVKMPEMDGFETASMIRQRPKLEHTPIIFITAYSTTELDRLKGYDMGAADYIFLPVIPEVLKAKVRVFVEMAKQRRIIENQAHALTCQNERQQGQIQLIENLNEQLRYANEELEAFSYSVSHDLRSPLRTIQGYARALLEECGPQLAPSAAGYLARIEKAALRMDALMQDVLAYSRLTKADIQIGPVDLETLIDEIVRDSGGLKLSKAKVTLSRPLDPVLGHEACLTQCLSNLLENSAKFVPPDTAPEIKVRTETRNGRVRIWVEDNGIGIDPAHHGRIFHMFGRVHPAKSYEGTGMGLTIVKRAVERMGGTLGVESSLGRGSRFWIELGARPAS
jgi:two-component system, sensor histidine kinase and response regulator